MSFTARRRRSGRRRRGNVAAEAGLTTRLLSLSSQLKQNLRSVTKPYHLKIQQMKYAAKLLKNLFFSKKSL
ncbi:hypothetical protein CHCC14821_3892 [Bacillus paralicheniformis]|nr:hypothetical protein CHCC14821_3892 [Bacillus paralicheniformis]TWM66102.1 hypothetical protein CHCC14814_2852 [Bacillus paralicheniformis]